MTPLDAPADEALARLFAHGGEMGRLMAETDWARTAVGPTATWPPSLRNSLGLLLGSASQLVLLWGTDFTQFYNDAFRPILGTTKHPAALGQRAAECWSEVWHVIHPMYARVMAGGATSIREGLLVLQRNGFLEECYFDYTYSPVRDEHAEVAGILAICSEVTDRVLSARRMRLLSGLRADSVQSPSAEQGALGIMQALATATADVPFALTYLFREDESELHLAGAAGIAPGSAAAPLIVRLDATGGWPLASALQGEQELELGALPFAASLPGGGWPEPARQALLFPILHQASGRRRGVLVLGVSPRLVLDAPYRDFFSLLSRHVASEVEQAVAVDALRDHREVVDAQRTRLYRHFMQAPFSIAVFRGPRHVIELANPDTLRSWGKGPEIVGLALVDAIPQLVGQPFLGYLDDVYATGVAYEGREELARLPVGPDGALADRYFNFVYAPLRDEAGEVEGVLLSAFIVTDQVRARIALETALARAGRSEAELRDVAERAAALTEELKHAAVVRERALLDAARIGRVKDEFLATMSHELRTPLNAILGWSKMVRTERVDEAQRAHALVVIERNAEAQARLIDDLLDVSRIISGKLLLTIDRVELSGVVLAALDVVRQAAESKRVSLVSEIDPGLGAMAADADRLQQIVWNLVANGVKFTPAGGTVTVRVERRESTVTLRVTDTGAGLSPDNLRSIFERFQQVDSSTTRTHGGLGLGLAIVRHLVEAHGGSVRAESAGLGRGASFIVTLPVHAVVAPSSTSHGPPPIADKSLPAPPEAPPRPLDKARILIVEDDADSRELLAALLEAEGASVTQAPDATHALELSAAQEYDLIVSDIGMPGQDGYQLLTALRERGVTTPAVALTAYARQQDVQRALYAGFQHHCSKPLDADELIAVLTRLRAQAGRAATS